MVDLFSLSFFFPPSNLSPSRSLVSQHPFQPKSTFRKSSSTSRLQMKGGICRAEEVALLDSTCPCSSSLQLAPDLRPFSTTEQPLSFQG